MRTSHLALVAGLALLIGGPSCTTMYDHQGRPQQVVTPEGAAMAAVAAGVVGYALANNNSKKHYRSYDSCQRRYCH